MVLATYWFLNLGFLFFWYSLWFWLSIDSGILVVFVLSTVFGYPLIVSGQHVHA